jgi:hypothetical protein
MKLNPVRSSEELRARLVHYLDERQKPATNRPNEALTPGKDYLPLADGIWVLGWIADAPDGPKMPRKPGEPVRIETVEDYEKLFQWWDNTAQGKQKAVHFAASFSPKLARAMAKKGLQVDSWILQSTIGAMDEFNRAFYPNSNIGYAVGIHHDEAVPHAHILVFPQTDTGVNIRTTTLWGETPDRYRFLPEAFNRDGLRLAGMFETAANPPLPEALPETMIASAWVSDLKRTNPAGPPTDELYDQLASSADASTRIPEMARELNTRWRLLAAQGAQAGLGETQLADKLYERITGDADQFAGRAKGRQADRATANESLQSLQPVDLGDDEGTPRGDGPSRYETIQALIKRRKAEEAALLLGIEALSKSHRSQGRREAITTANHYVLSSIVRSVISKSPVPDAFRAEWLDGGTPPCLPPISKAEIAAAYEWGLKYFHQPVEEEHGGQSMS